MITVTDMNAVFEGCLALVINCGLIGYGIGLILNIIRSAAER